jgi:hypothetical protein
MRAFEDLLEADRAFGRAENDAESALSEMFSESVLVPVPRAGFARGKAEALAAVVPHTGARFRWAPLSGGLSADGAHGFTFGYMTMSSPAGPERRAKYLAYWERGEKGWRVTAFKHLISPAGSAPPLHPRPVLPERLVQPLLDDPALSLHRSSLDGAERAFSDAAQRTGLGPAFRLYGTPDSVNLGRTPAFTLGAGAIAQELEAAGFDVSWAPDGVTVASSGDLGMTWGVIRSNRAPAGAPTTPYFTVWRRPDAGAPWRYIAE